MARAPDRWSCSGECSPVSGMFVIGDQEVGDRTVSVSTRAGSEIRDVPVPHAIEHIRVEVESSTDGALER